MMFPYGGITSKIFYPYDSNILYLFICETCDLFLQHLYEL